MKRFLAEVVGTAALVFIGCGAIAIGGLGGALGTAPLGPIALLPIGLAFGLAVTAMAYGIGPVSGCHLNPAVTVAMVAAGRQPVGEAIGYIISQVIGAFVGAGFLALILRGKAGGYDIEAMGLGQTTWSTFSMTSALIAELVGTFIFVVVILGATQAKFTTQAAGLVIGLTLAVLHLALVPVSGNSLNPARSLAPAVYVGGDALKQVWLYLVVPTIGGLLAGLAFKTRLLAADD